MDIKIYVLMLLIGAIVALYHLANPSDAAEREGK